jgi:DNA-binding beta-propeller fold protein YncE
MKWNVTLRLAVVMTACALFFPVNHLLADDFDTTTETVGANTNGLMTPVNQLVTPAGIQVQLPGVRPSAVALSPDGKILVTAGLTRELIVVDPATGQISQRVPFPADEAQPEIALTDAILTTNQMAKMSFTGLTFSPDGTRLYLSNVNGDVKAFGVDAEGTITPL